MEDVVVETADLSSKFKFFETYKPTEKERKKFRITPPREGQVKVSEHIILCLRFAKNFGLIVNLPGDFPMVGGFLRVYSKIKTPCLRLSCQKFFLDLIRYFAKNKN